MRTLQGSIEIPPSKSQTLRAILFGALGHGKTVIRNYLDSPDTVSMIAACKSFGAKIKGSDRLIEIEGTCGHITPQTNELYCGNSGIVLRFCTAVFALANQPVIITGDASIRSQRPMKPLLEGLSQLGAKVISLHGNGFAPISIQGPLKPGQATISGEDSQPISALLIALSFLKGPSKLTVQNPGEKPWVALTLNWLDRLGIAYTNEGFHSYEMKGNASYPGFEYSVPGDLSSASFPIAAALITGSEITVGNVDFTDSQGDKELIAVFQKMGACLEIDQVSKRLYVRKGGALKGIRVDINNFIDGITVLAALACFAEGETVIYNGAIARQKECNRISCIASELKKMGADIEETEDGLRVRKSSLKGAKADSCKDHRMAMSLAVAALGAEGETLITDTDCIAKTFPTFVTDFNRMGAGIKCEGHSMRIV